MTRIAYFRVSSIDQTIDSQRAAMLKDAAGAPFDKEFKDEGVSGTVPAASRPGFGELLKYIRNDEGDTIHVYAVDRLGRDALDVQSTVRALMNRGVTVHVHGLGPIAKGVGELILAVLAQVADMERNKIKERTAAGRDAAKKSLMLTGKTQNGKTSMGRPFQADPFAVVNYRKQFNGSIADAAAQFGISEATVKRYCAQVSASKSVKHDWHPGQPHNTQRVKKSTLVNVKQATE
jgi:putative DNA-invertase from lambdoid prophage Rac